MKKLLKNINFKHLIIGIDERIQQIASFSISPRAHLTKSCCQQGAVNKLVVCEVFDRSASFLSI